MSDELPRWLSLDELRLRHSYKWRAYPPDALPTFVAEMDVSLAPAISRTLREAVDRGDTGYATPDPALAEALSAFHTDRFGWAPEPKDVLLLPDVMAGICELLRVAVPPGSAVVVNPPVYPPFFSDIGLSGCRVVEAPLARAGSGYALDFDALDSAFAAGAAAYLLCNPHNPTGLVPSAAELGQVAELALRHHVLVLADEIHAPLALPGAHHIPYLSLPEARANGVAFTSATKGWNLPGLKCAQAMSASEPMRALLRRLPEDIGFRAGNLGVAASVAAYGESVGWLDGLLSLLDQNRALLADLLARRLPEVGFVWPQATYLAWLDCSRLGLAEDPARVFLRRGRVALRPGPDFGSGGAGWVRATIATSPEIITEIVERMRVSLG